MCPTMAINMLDVFLLVEEIFLNRVYMYRVEGGAEFLRLKSVLVISQYII
jgi:hypothetical protein